ncbi:phage tail protein [Pyramidobacter porci]
MYASVLTKTGMAQLLGSQITGASLKWSKMGVGDGDGAPVGVDANRTSLVHECYRANINHLFRDPDDATQIVAELVMLPEEGGYTIREVGVYDENEQLVVYGSLPEITKPVLAEGSGVTLTVRCRAAVSEAANVELIVDPAAVIATRAYVDGELDAHSGAADAHPPASGVRPGFMSSADKSKLDGIAANAEVNQNSFTRVKVGGTIVEADQKSDTLELAAGSNIILTPDAVNDKITIGLPPTLGVDVTGSAAKLQTKRKINNVDFDGTANITITAAANGGTSASCSGNAASATKLQTARTINGVDFDGTQNITIPVQEYAAMSKTTAGYIKFKHSGIIFQWVRSAQFNDNGTATVTFPIAFPAACAICVGGTAERITVAASQIAVTAWTKTNCTAKSGAGGGGQMRSATIIAIGY